MTLSPLEEAQLAKRARFSSNMSYRSVVHVRPTSNMVERLFSQAKYVMTDHRKRMDPDHLNELMILKYHKVHWNAALVDACITQDVEIV